MSQKIKDALGNIADVITKVTRDGKELVIIKKAYRDFDEKEAKREQRILEDVASECIRDWRELFGDKRE